MRGKVNILYKNLKILIKIKEKDSRLPWNKQHVCQLKILYKNLKILIKIKEKDSRLPWNKQHVCQYRFSASSHT